MFLLSLTILTTFHALATGVFMKSAANADGHRCLEGMEGVYGYNLETNAAGKQTGYAFMKKLDDASHLFCGCWLKLACLYDGRVTKTRKTDQTCWDPNYVYIHTVYLHVASLSAMGVDTDGTCTLPSPTQQLHQPRKELAWNRSKGCAVPLHDRHPIADYVKSADGLSAPSTVKVQGPSRRCMNPACDRSADDHINPSNRLPYLTCGLSCQRVVDKMPTEQVQKLSKIKFEEVVDTQWERLLGHGTMLEQQMRLMALAQDDRMATSSQVGHAQSSGVATSSQVGSAGVNAPPVPKVANTGVWNDSASPWDEMANGHKQSNSEPGEVEQLRREIEKLRKHNEEQQMHHQQAIIAEQMVAMRAQEALQARYLYFGGFLLLLVDSNGCHSVCGVTDLLCVY